MASVDNVSVNTTTTANGQTYTKTISNDGLTNEDFLKLMLEELKLQDPTKPMDSASMLDSQMQMSSIQTNLSTIEAMKSLQNSFAQMALASATDVIGRIVENGSYGQDGNLKSFQITSVESLDGEVVATGYEVIGYDKENGKLLLSEDMSQIKYDNITKIY
ncbi:flagellar hook capping FlgD N-terminal domain-containing protein [Arcobacter sp.]|uniref:flagellar hook capping FlgD N-terminal domain-containing protein n=1 Tax=Arcobacter sp. TaxID=1872629 RepID=UPI003D10A3BA